MNHQQKEKEILKKKNPYKIFELAKQYQPWNKIIEDKNSFIWENCIEIYYPLKKNNYSLTKLDYYMVLYYVDCINELSNDNYINLCIKALETLPKIYDGDHICIVHICNTLACRKFYNSGELSICLFRTKDKTQESFFPNKEGKLQCRFIEKKTNQLFQYNNKSIENIIIKNKLVTPLYGSLII